LRGYGNSIVPQVAARFIRESLEVISGLASGNLGMHDGQHGDPR